jgi:hypothetical protein
VVHHRESHHDPPAALVEPLLIPPKVVTVEVSLPGDGGKVCAYLISEVLPRQAVVTYQELHDSTGVMFGPEGGYIGQVFEWVFHACDRRKLPPITAVVVNAGQNQSELNSKSQSRYAFLGLATGSRGWRRRRTRWGRSKLMESELVELRRRIDKLGAQLVLLWWLVIGLMVVVGWQIADLRSDADNTRAEVSMLSDRQR